MNQPIDKEEYKGFTINIYRDDMYDDSNDDGIGELHCRARDLYMGAVSKDGKEVSAPESLDRMTVEYLLDLLKENFIYSGSFGSHSGVWLHSNPTEVTTKEVTEGAKAQYELYKGDESFAGDSFEEWIMWQECDNGILSREGESVLLFIPRDKDENGKYTNTAYGMTDIDAVAKSSWKTWDDLIQGNVYGYTVTDKDGDETDMSMGFCRRDRGRSE